MSAVAEVLRGEERGGAGHGIGAAERPIALALLVVAVGLFVFHARIYWGWTEDDAYITFRYAQNVAAGHGLVFNPGERVEGYSNLSWVLLGAAAIRAGLDPVAVAKGVGLVAAVLALMLCWRLALRLRPGIGLCALLGPFYLAISPVLVQHSVAALETAVFAVLVIAALLVTIDARPGGRLRRTVRVGLLLLLALTRVEGPAVAVLLLLLRGLRARRGPTPWRGEAAAFLLLFGTYYVWRWIYFGAPLANTFYAKANGGLYGVIDGVQYTVDFIRDSGGALFLALALVPLFLGEARPAYVAALVLLFAYAAFVVGTGGDWMYHYRFYAHVLPVIAALLAVGIDGLLGLARTKTVRAGLLNASLALVLLTTCVSIGNTELRVARAVLPALASHNYLSQNYEELGLWFKENSDPDATVAISDVGAVGYFSGRRILDMFGLIDPHIARLRGRLHYKADPRYVLSRAPDFVVLVSLNDEGAGYSFSRIPDYSMNVLPEFHESYDLIRTVPQYWGNEFVLVYRRKS